MKWKLDRPVIVEGKYDKIALENVIDAPIIPTNGFRIFKDPEKRALIRALAQKNGVIVMTDSDQAGGMIRAYIKKIVGDVPIIPVYVPCLEGVERRKKKPSKEGYLGVEGFSREILCQALEKSGVTVSEQPPFSNITRQDLYACGLFGRKNSAEKRKKLLAYLGLPTSLSTSATVDALQVLLTREEWEERVLKWLTDTDKN